MLGKNFYTESRLPLVGSNHSTLGSLGEVFTYESVLLIHKEF